jgi:hypothetical protein
MVGNHQAVVGPLVQSLFEPGRYGQPPLDVKGMSGASSKHDPGFSDTLWYFMALPDTFRGKKSPCQEKILKKRSTWQFFLFRDLKYDMLAKKCGCPLHMGPNISQDLTGQRK